MGEKINNILKGEIISSVFYILLGLKRFVKKFFIKREFSCMI